MGRAVLMLLLAVMAAGCAPDIAPMSVQECEMRDHIASVRYLRTQTMERVRRTRQLRKEWRLQAAQVDTLAAFFNGVQPQKYMP